MMIIKFENSHPDSQVIRGAIYTTDIMHHRI